MNALVGVPALPGRTVEESTVPLDWRSALQAHRDRLNAGKRPWYDQTHGLRFYEDGSEWFAIHETNHGLYGWYPPYLFGKRSGDREGLWAEFEQHLRECVA